MKSICKLLVDLSFYYTLSGYFLIAFTHNHPYPWGILLLMAAAVLYIVIRNRKLSAPAFGDDVPSDGSDVAKPVKIALCALPAAIFLTNVSVWQIVQFVPGWVFIVLTILQDRIHTTRFDFMWHFRFTSKFFWTMLIGIVALPRLGEAIVGTVPYLLVYLLISVCLTRMLREQGKLRAGRNFAVIAVLLIAGIVLVFFQVPTLILDALGFVYHNVIVWAIFGVTYALGWLLYGVFNLIARVVNLDFSYYSEPPQLVEIPLDVFEEYLYFDVVTTPDWVNTVVVILLALIVAVIFVVVLRKMLGNNIHKPEAVYTEEQEMLQKRERGSGGKLLRPREPRRAVRWYYRKYLQLGILKGERSGFVLQKSDTSLDVFEKSSGMFSEDEERELRELYTKARYGQRAEIDKGDSELALRLWRTIKSSSKRA